MKITDLPVELLSEIALALPSLQHAAAMACACKAFRNSVRDVNACFFSGDSRRCCLVVDVVNGVNGVDVAGRGDGLESIQDALRRCPEGGGIRLLPGEHAGPVAIDRRVHIFAEPGAIIAGRVVCAGRHGASITGCTLKSAAFERTLYVHEGSDVTLRECTLSSVESEVVRVDSGTLTLDACRVAGGLSIGVSIVLWGANVAATVHDCEVESAGGCMAIVDGATATVRGNTFRTLADGTGCIYIGDARGHIHENRMHGMGAATGRWAVEHDPDFQRSAIHVDPNNVWKGHAALVGP